MYTGDSTSSVIPFVEEIEHAGGVSARGTTHLATPSQEPAWSVYPSDEGPTTRMVRICRGGSLANGSRRLPEITTEKPTQGTEQNALHFPGVGNEALTTAFDPPGSWTVRLRLPHQASLPDGAPDAAVNAYPDPPPQRGSGRTAALHGAARHDAPVPLCCVRHRAGSARTARPRDPSTGCPSRQPA